MPSANEPLCFDLSVFVEAWWDGPEPVPHALLDIAQDGIARRAERVTRGRTLTALERLRGELNTALLNWDWVVGTRVMARGHCVSIDTDPELLAAVFTREEAIRRHLVRSWLDEKRAHQTEQMSALILDPLRATAAWFLDNQEKSEHIVTIARKFKDLRDILKPERQPDSPGVLLDELLATADQSCQLHLFRVLRRTFEEYSGIDLILRLDQPNHEPEET